MKKKLSKKTLSIFIAMLMVVSILPAGTITASAATEQYALWFMNDMYFTQSPGGNYSHYGTQNFDVVGYSSNNIFAPFDCKIVAKYTSLKSGNTVIIESTSKVHYANGKYDYMSMAFAHDNDISDLYVGKKIKQGEVFYQTGTYGNATGRHSHVTCIKGKYKFDMWTCNKYGNFCSPNAINPVDALYKKSTTKVINSAGLSFKTYSEQLFKPTAPKIISNVSGDIAVGTNVTVSWSGVSNATGYIVKVNGAQVQKSTATKYAFTASSAKSYAITVYAYNSSYTSSVSNTITVTGKSPSTVTFKDYDGTVLSSQTVKYGSAAVSPASPSREGYTFDGWDGTYSKVTSNLTVTATYKINTYTVKFIDKDGNILSSQNVDYLNDATPPENTNAPTGYEFLGWSSDEYLSVKNDAAIQAIYSWGNTDLPIVANITSAVRQDDGYYVYFDLTNYPDAITRGRAVVSLKTSDGKLVDATESAAFSIPKDGIKTGMEVFIPCEKAATKVELVIVNSYSSGVPISEMVSSTIDQGKAWSEWSTDEPEEGAYEYVESRTEYRYRDKSTKTSSSGTMDGWELYDTSWVWSSYGSWSSWSKTKATASDSRKVETRTVTDTAAYTKYNYYYYRYYNSSAKAYYYTYSSSMGGTKYTKTLKSPMTYYATYDGHKAYIKGSGSYYNFSGELWFLSSTQTVAATTHTEYRYADRSKVYTYYFYKWGDWSDWSSNAVASTDTREVETRTVYRYRSNDAGMEDLSGETRNISGQLDSSYAGKQATLLIYKVDEASDYSNEYVAQTTINDDGSYSFTYKLREEPTVKTGDFTIALGVEGTTNTFIIGTIDAPKPEYTVNFYDYAGNIISSQVVIEGNSAVVPNLEEREGYTFIGWDSNTTNIRDNLDIHPQYTQNEYTVVFVNWETDSIDIKTFLYGEKLLVPDVEPIEGYNLTGWENVEEGETIVTQDMIATATYDKEVYEVNFYDFEGNLISSQNVAYGESANVPDDLEAENIIFLGWNSPDFSDFTEVKEDMDLLPQYIYEDTVETPSADVETGVYDNKQTVTLSCDNENAVIFYTTDGSDPSIMGNIYTEPITISSTCNLRFVACAFAMNNSDIVDKYYCINNPDIPSDWMTYSELPESVINNFDDYRMELDTGYKYKNTQLVSDMSIAEQLVADGWSYNGSTYTDYTDWQDEPIEMDNSKPGFEIDTQEVEDATVIRYQYSHYKYTDENGDTQYSKSAVDGFDCEYETITLDNSLSVAGFVTINGINTSYFNYDNQIWFTQTKVSGVKTQYRSRYQVDEYYKWSNWTTEVPSSTETREYITDDVYRYYNKNHYIVNIPNLSERGTILLIQENQILDMSEYDIVTGYDFDGLYFDEDYTQNFDLSTPITESLTLYAKYTPKTYTVVFQLEDETELDTQMVSYMESATAPDVYVVPGYVFAGWDKDFDYITENIIVTAKYISEDEYALISLNRENAKLYQGNTLTLIATITPSNLSKEEIVWNSSNYDVADVDDKGNVTAISEGTAVITATVVKTNEKAYCTVEVALDDTMNLILKTNTSLNYDALGYLRRIGFSTTVETVSNEFTNDTLYFYNISGTELSSTDYVGTGTQIKLFNGENIVDTKTVIVTGDMTGDGIINNRDVALMNKYLVTKATAEEYQILAIDVNGDGSVNNRDAAMVARYLVGKEAL